MQQFGQVALPLAIFDKHLGSRRLSLTSREIPMHFPKVVIAEYTEFFIVESRA
jgi:hypothetical protein